MSSSSSRRSIFNRLRGGPPQLRPPWSLGEDEFLDRCTRCGDCAGACPLGLVVDGHGGFPIVSFAHAHCTFCGACADACKASCFDRSMAAPWNLVASISGACVETIGVTCRICEEGCEQQAIRFRPKLGAGSHPSIIVTDCTGCGACVAACPVHAISIRHTAETVGEGAAP